MTWPGLLIQKSNFIGTDMTLTPWWPLTEVGVSPPGELRTSPNIMLFLIRKMINCHLIVCINSRRVLTATYCLWFPPKHLERSSAPWETCGEGSPGVGSPIAFQWFIYVGVVSWVVVWGTLAFDLTSLEYHALFHPKYRERKKIKSGLFQDFPQSDHRDYGLWNSNIIKNSRRTKWHETERLLQIKKKIVSSLPMKRKGSKQTDYLLQYRKWNIRPCPWNN